MIVNLVEGGWWLLHGFSKNNGDNGSIDISHLLFADNALIFCGAHLGQIQSLRALLFCFETISGLSGNLSKSELVLVGVVPKAKKVNTLLGCKVSSLPLKYIGLALGASFKS